MMSKADTNLLDETTYLLRSPENARRLLAALHGDRKKDRVFADIDELRSELGRGARGAE